MDKSNKWIVFEGGGAAIEIFNEYFVINIVTMKTPLRYPGGKTRARRVLMDIMCKFFDMSKVKVLLSPFFGGGSFEFFAQQQQPGLRIVANDAFEPLINFWRQAQRRRAALCREIEQSDPLTKSQFDNLVAQGGYYAERSRLLQACKFFLINRCSFNGLSLSGSYSKQPCNKSLLRSSVQCLRDLDLRRVEFHDCEVEDFLMKFRCSSQEETLTFLDPPYYLSKRRSNLYGIKGHLHKEFDHERLHRLLATRRRWMMTYNDCPYIRELYKDHIIIDVSWYYSMSKTNRSSEIVIVSI